MAECKTKGSEEQNVTDFTIQLAPFLHVFYCFVFPLATFFILCAIGLSLFFNAFRHPAYLPSLCVSLLLSISLFLNLHYISSYSFLGIKKF